MEIKVIGNISNHAPLLTALRCPHCGHTAVPEVLGQHDVGVTTAGVVCGQRRCPNPDCLGHLFVVYDSNGVLATYPPVRLDFDPGGIPSDIVKSLEDAITCHASGCYLAAALMVRRTLEDVCADRGATGATLKDRLQDLRGKIVLPQELLDAMDELRILGNDAAHVEAKTYASISEVEVTVAIEFTKEILKGLYQYASLLGKLRELKTVP